MNTFRRAVLAALIPIVLVGCASAPMNRTLNAQLASAIQPLDLHVGIKQHEVYAEFEHSNLGAGAVACGAVPGLGLLLAAACGGALGAMDTSINADRAKVADEMVRPLKDMTVDARFDQLLHDTISKSLQGVPKMQFAHVALTKSVDDKTIEQTFRASTSNAVMFVILDYHLSRDFSSVEVSANGFLYPRSTSARTAAGLSAQSAEEDKGRVLRADQAAYRVEVTYRGVLPSVAPTPEGNIEMWKANNASLLRKAISDGATQVGRLLADDIQRAPGAERVVLGTADAGKGTKGELLATNEGAQLIRIPSGAFVYSTTVSAPLQQATAGTKVVQ
ncbi:hypothetical protein [Noviherbaspirillum aerium]|uniref:hypothetical protein n=1 Tax=Noviherbaspirillum aerium TaxID=2588497 RepID=UPI00124C1D73|nr:hypothetical protein [Noviherbaspirillum aerium]